MVMTVVKYNWHVNRHEFKTKKITWTKNDKIQNRIWPITEAPATDEAGARGLSV